MTSKVDLHTHSTASDGTNPPAELVERAAAAGLAGIALTDHDTLAGLAEARAACARRGLRFLAGVELSTHWHDLQNVHLLGYRVDGLANGPLVAACKRLRHARDRRAEVIVERLNAAGVGLRLEAVRLEAGHGVVGRPHVARALVAGGWATSSPHAFEQWLTPGKPGYVPHENLATSTAVELLRQCGAVPVLAHPQTLRLAPVGLEVLVRDLVGHGLAGIEAYWSQQDPATVELCEKLAAQYGLLATGGSDFHGANKPNQLGTTAFHRRLDLEIMDKIEAVAARPPTHPNAEKATRAGILSARSGL